MAQHINLAGLHKTQSNSAIAHEHLLLQEIKKEARLFDAYFLVKNKY